MTISTRDAFGVAAIVWRRPHPDAAASAFELLITHPGAPLFAGQDLGAWLFPTQEHTATSTRESDLVETALRALDDATGLLVETVALPLGEIITADGYRLIAFAFEADSEPPRAHLPPQLRMEWPAHSGFELAFPAVDAAAFVLSDEAGVRLHPSQREFVTRLVQLLSSQESVS